MNDFQLSEHFSFFELTKTDFGAFLEDNRQEGLVYSSALASLCKELLEPLRNQFGPIHVTSGFRCRTLNQALGIASPVSQHLIGQAADVNQVADMSEAGRLAMVNWLRTSGLKWHQALDEFECLHISLPTGINDGQMKYAEPDPSKPGSWITRDITVQEAT